MDNSQNNDRYLLRNNMFMLYSLALVLSYFYFYSLYDGELLVLLELVVYFLVPCCAAR